MTGIRHVLFIMCDQLRWDYLSCSGHPHLKTPHIDRLASKGVRFNRAYVQSPICGPSRMSFYTGRYMTSHGSHWNGFPLKVGEWTLGDYVRPLGAEATLVGKTHMTADQEGMERLGVDPDSIIGVRVAECGFDPFERDDGVHPGQRPDRAPPRYNEYLAEKGYDTDNGWRHWANSVDDGDGAERGGWFLKYVNRPARVREEDSETPYMTRRAMEYIDQAGDRPWVCHLSFIKPHWPYVAPAPYNAMYGPEHVKPAVRSARERDDPHPVYATFMDQRVSHNFSRDEVRARVVPVYMGLIKQIDDQMGVLFAHLEATGRMADTMIVFTSDHGDYLGDHWMGEKDLFHDASARVPLIIYDPRPQADATRGTVSDDLVQAIDLVPTFIEALGGKPPYQRLEGRSLEPLLHGARPDDWRDYVVSEYDYSVVPNRLKLGRPTDGCRMVMIADERWKWINFQGFERKMLFDLANDPDELVDLGAEPGFEEVHWRMERRFAEWCWRPAQRTTVTNEQIEMRTERMMRSPSLMNSFWDEKEAGIDPKSS